MPDKAGSCKIWTELFAESNVQGPAMRDRQQKMPGTRHFASPIGAEAGDDFPALINSGLR